MLLHQHIETLYSKLEHNLFTSYLARIWNYHFRTWTETLEHNLSRTMTTTTMESAESWVRKRGVRAKSTSNLQSLCVHLLYDLVFLAHKKVKWICTRRRMHFFQLRNEYCVCVCGVVVASISSHTLTPHMDMLKRIRIHYNQFSVQCARCTNARDANSEFH